MVICGFPSVYSGGEPLLEIAANNRKGIFFEDGNIEHMAFLVAGRWSELGPMIIRVSEYDDTGGLF